jgi:hypothetical protein
MIARLRCLCTVSFLEASLLENLDFMCYLDGVCTAATSVKVFRLCASVVLLGYCVVVETRCN